MQQVRSHGNAPTYLRSSSDGPAIPGRGLEQKSSQQACNNATRRRVTTSGGSTIRL